MDGGGLVYVMGPSGAGKDSVLQYARAKLDGRHPVVFAHRYITRPPGEDIENYISLSPGEFALREARGLFAYAWAAYGIRYGIGIEIGAWRAAGLLTVVDGSRAHFIAHAGSLDGATPVLITASAEELRRRLRARGREDARWIEQRLQRATEFAPAHPSLLVIDNSGPLERAGEALAAFLIRQAAPRSGPV
jgi:ribose 1,5-bisphosphokinase